MSRGSWRPAAVPVLVFAGLVVATFAAFFVTTRLKRAAPVVEQLTFRRSFSPNGDGRFDVALLAFRLRRSDDVTVSIVTRDGDEVRTLAEDVFLERGGAPSLSLGRPLTTRAALRPTASTTCASASATRPAPSLRRASCSSTHARRGPSCATCRRTRSHPTARAVRTARRCASPGRRGVRACWCTARTWPARGWWPSARSPAANSTTRWDGRVTGGGAAPTGSYLMVVRAQDAAGNVGPRRVPPTRAEVRGHPGLNVRYLAARPARTVAFARGRMSFEVAADGRRYRWSVRRLGARRAVARAAEQVEHACRYRCASAAPASPCSTCASARAATRLPSRCRREDAGASWSCCRTRPGRRAIAWSRTATATRTCSPPTPAWARGGRMRGAASRRASPATPPRCCASSTPSACVTTSPRTC